MTASMQAATDLYVAAGRLELDRVCVEDEGFQAFSLAVRELQKRLGEDASDSYWRPVLARLRRVRWELATVPLPFRHPAFALHESAAFLTDRLRDCDRVFPAHSAAVPELRGLLADLSRRVDNPLGDAVCDLALPGRSVLLLRDTRHAAAVEESVARALGVAVLAPTRFARSRVYEAAAIIGPTSWFPRQVFSAPRACQMHVIQFGWLSDPPFDPRLFAGSQMGAGLRASSLPGHEGRASQGSGIASAELLPVTDWTAIASGTGGTTDGSEERPDTVEAYLLLLASEQAVYLEAEEGSRAQVAELGSSKELHMVATRSIQPGTYVVNRVGGEGDYIPAIADSLLGNEAPRLRAAQRRWKERLRDLIDSVGVQGVLSRLAAAGALRASRANLRRWASASSIRTEDYADFAGVMKIIGLGAEADDLWRDMDLIDQAHLRAGQRVRKLLVREILNGDTRELEVRGWQDYDVERSKGRVR